MRKQNMRIVIALFGLILLILDSKTVTTGMTEGITICLQTLIPSLFPFILLTRYLSPFLIGRDIFFLRPLGRLLGMPQGTQSIFLIGLLSGYPVGAQYIGNAVESGQISQKNGQRMLAFCSNAGPAFLFGIGTRLFPSLMYCWIAWMIHIISAMIVARLTPCDEGEQMRIQNNMKPSDSDALSKATKTMVLICAWVCIFRVIILFCQRWILWRLPVTVQFLISGFLELANGCCALAQVSSVTCRFVLFSAFLGFGGLCIGMQTAGVCGGLKLSWYLGGKVVQSILSVLLSLSIISREMIPILMLTMAAVCTLYYAICKKSQNGVAFSQNKLYNEKKRKRGICYAFSKKSGAPLRLLHTQHPNQ